MNDIHPRTQYRKETGYPPTVDDYLFEEFTEDYVLWLEKNLEVTEQLLKSCQQVLDAIPECPQHGKCVPHALEWIQEKKNET